MSLYMIYVGGLRFYVTVTPQGKRIVPRDEAEIIWSTMHSHRGTV
ncbi:Uncharacterised protein [Vibrio vulnificus]|nr:Uncharacterised protein [Vibrio vulnificus]